MDITAVFASKTAPPRFDPLPEAFVNITGTIKMVPTNSGCTTSCTMSLQIPREVGANQGKGYEKVCCDLGILLAKSCLNDENAFGSAIYVTVWCCRFQYVKIRMVHFSGEGV